VEKIHIGNRIRDIEEINGSIWMLFDNGELASISPSNEIVPTKIPNGLEICLTCHNINRGTTHNAPAPSLRGVYNRIIASTNFQSYSKGLRSLKESSSENIWTEKKLFLFIKNPQSISSDSSMLKYNLSDSKINLIIDSLKKLN
jgi:cytochrome c2